MYCVAYEMVSNDFHDFISISNGKKLEKWKGLKMIKLG